MQKKFRKLCLALSALFVAAIALSACEQPLTDGSASKNSIENSINDGSSSWAQNGDGSFSGGQNSDGSSSLTNDSSLENGASSFEGENESSNGDSAGDTSDSSVNSSAADSSTDEEQEDREAWAIVDALYALDIGEYLDGTYVLTGTVIDITKSGKKTVVHIVVRGREDKPVQCYNLQGTGVSSLQEGDVITVQGELTNYQGKFEFDNGCVLLSGGNAELPPSGGDPYANVSKATFYANYTPAKDGTDAYYRSLHGFMSGELTVPDQAPTLARNRPKSGNSFLKNKDFGFSENGKAYTVVDEHGMPSFTIYQGGGYITLEEVAAYVYAFGTYPANYTTDKNPSPSNSLWGEYLRANHTRFSGDTDKYPYEPELPNISGCGGKLQYYEMDLGTTGTDCDPSYEIKTYNDGSEITRGAARIVYGKNDLNGNGIYETGELHVFYTYNHYNDFQEYLNYEGGWGERFGNITGGGTLSSKKDYNPTSYVSVIWQSFSATPYATCAIPEDYKALLKAYI